MQFIDRRAIPNPVGTYAAGPPRRSHLMRSLTRTLGVLFVLAVVSLPAAADKAKTLYNEGRAAEARQNYEGAYDSYKKAYDLKPEDLRYRAAFERVRFLAAAARVHRGQLMRESGQLEMALAEFEHAATIDPSSDIARQEIQRTRKLIEAAKSQPKSQVAPPPTEIQKMIQQAGGPIQLAPISNVPITLKLTEDAKVIYETVGKLAGVNVLFDPDYTSRRIKIELNGVTLRDALEIVALESKTFWRPVTSNTIFVAADNPAKRKELEQSVIKTFYLSNVSQPTELQDVVNAMRQILEVSRIQQLPSQNAIVIRGTPDQVALAEKLIGDIDKARPEVIVEVAVMQVSRDKMRTLGISPPTSGTVALQSNLNNTTNNNNNNNNLNNGLDQTNTNSGTQNTVNLNRIGNLTATDFQVTIPPATATALFTDSDSKLIQNPQIRALDNQKASLKIGQRVPVATGSFQPGIGGVGINPLVNTQFQYLDVGVNIDITPHVHNDRSVTLKVALDISAVDSQTNIGGITQPVIGQRKIEHEIRLQDGEVNLLGGILEHQDTKSLTGYPWLANIPILKYLFSQSTTEKRDNEIVFVLVPHIVRNHDVDDLNQRAIDVGTANAIDLRRASSAPAQTSPAQPQNAPASVPAQPSAQPAPSQPGNTPPAGASLNFDPAAVTQPVGSTFAVNIMVNGGQNVYSVPVQLSYDPKSLAVVNVSNGSFLSRDGQAVALVHRDDPTTGTLQVTATRPPNSGGVSGQGDIFTITFMAKAAGQSTLSITRGGLRDGAMQPIEVAGSQATISIR
jgi:general secretion pathway protein D